MNMGIAAFVLLSAAVPQAEILPSLKREPLQCDRGPLYRTYGGSDWIVYSCSDGASIVVVTRQGNPAHPFYFMLTIKDGKHQLHGEGNGARDVTAAAFEDLRRLTPEDIVALIEEAGRSER